MKAAIAITAAGFMSFGLVSTASAWHLAPESSSFTADGKTSATKGGVTLPCKAHFEGTIDANGVGHVTGGSFKDVPGGQGCALVQLSNLPWPVTATGKRTVVLSNVQFTTPIGSCGPGDMDGKVRNSKLVITAAPLPPNCTVSANVTTTPSVSIVRH
jgi:hypothetical protein